VRPSTPWLKLGFWTRLLQVAGVEGEAEGEADEIDEEGDTATETETEEADETINGIDDEAAETDDDDDGCGPRRHALASDTGNPAKRRPPTAKKAADRMFGVFFALFVFWTQM
jgi:hypothetical protein